MYMLLHTHTCMDAHTHSHTTTATTTTKEIQAVNLRSKLVPRNGWREEMGERDIIAF